MYMSTGKSDKDYQIVVLGKLVGMAKVNYSHSHSQRRLSFYNNRELVNEVLEYVKNGYEVELHDPTNNDIQYVRYYNTNERNAFYSRTTPQAKNN